ncbi:hypothetical protein [Cysteiniphilum litorale]|uniref:hypothetical protein n=1 Tax=Cysteiniphilum litorale TaxID=2056700 RepID=UPI003F884685
MSVFSESAICAASYSLKDYLAKCDKSSNYGYDACLKTASLDVSQDHIKVFSSPPPLAALYHLGYKQSEPLDNNGRKFSGINTPHYSMSVFYAFGTFSQGNNESAGERGQYDKWCEDLNNIKFDGHSNWRPAKVSELKALFDFYGDVYRSLGWPGYVYHPINDQYKENFDPSQESTRGYPFYWSDSKLNTHGTANFESVNLFNGATTATPYNDRAKNASCVSDRQLSRATTYENENIILDKKSEFTFYAENPTKLQELFNKSKRITFEIDDENYIPEIIIPASLRINEGQEVVLIRKSRMGVVLSFNAIESLMPHKYSTTLLQYLDGNFNQMNYSAENVIIESADDIKFYSDNPLAIQRLLNLSRRVTFIINDDNWVGKIDLSQIRSVTQGHEFIMIRKSNSPVTLYFNKSNSLTPNKHEPARLYYEGNVFKINKYALDHLVIDQKADFELYNENPKLLTALFKKYMNIIFNVSDDNWVPEIMLPDLSENEMDHVYSSPVGAEKFIFITNANKETKLVSRKNEVLNFSPDKNTKTVYVHKMSGYSNAFIKASSELYIPSCASENKLSPNSTDKLCLNFEKAHQMLFVESPQTDVLKHLGYTIQNIPNNQGKTYAQSFISKVDGISYALFRQDGKVAMFNGDDPDNGKYGQFDRWCQYLGEMEFLGKKKWRRASVSDYLKFFRDRKNFLNSTWSTDFNYWSSDSIGYKTFYSFDFQKGIVNSSEHQWDLPLRGSCVADDLYKKFAS